MKKLFDMRFLFAFGMVLLVFNACGTSEPTAGGENATAEIGTEEASGDIIFTEPRDEENRSRPGIRIDPTRPLIDHLRQAPGIVIKRSGADYGILIRGQSRFEREENAMFVVNGVRVGRSYSDAENMISMENVTEINVYSGSRAIIRFGEDGIFGVIEIITD